MNQYEASRRKGVKLDESQRRRYIRMVQNGETRKQYEAAIERAKVTLPRVRWLERPICP